MKKIKKVNKVNKVNTVDKATESAKLAVASIQSAMKRKGLTLADMCRAITFLVNENQRQAILKMRAQGESIRTIARTFHVDERRISALIKASKAAQKPCKCCKVAGK